MYLLGRIPLFAVKVFNGICSDSVSVMVFVNLPPIISTSDVSITTGTSLTITAETNEDATYNWNPPIGLSCTKCQNPVASPVENTIYYVSATNNKGCTTIDSVIVTLLAEEPLCDVFVPTAFMPDKGGVNGLECVMGDCIETFDFAIYNRWGEKIFETTDQQSCWDGTYKGSPLNTGVYVYYLEATLIGGKKVHQKGNISLIR